MPPLNPPAPEAKSRWWAGGVERSGGPRGGHVAAASAIVSNPVVDMKVLVVYRPGDADGVYAMVKGYLDILGIPYATLDTSQAAPAGTLEAADLWDGVEPRLLLCGVHHDEQHLGGAESGREDHADGLRAGLRRA